jgi:NAD(P)-dependent dehydrogenase (short-subunit alcohol dehydrogenase family)
MRTNFYGPLNITRAVLPNLRSKGSGTLVFISSINGWVGGIGGTPYVSSKFALEGQQVQLPLLFPRCMSSYALG